MTSSQRSKYSAIVLFLLIAIVVIGGMAWGTVVTFRLTEYNIEEDRRKEIRRVVSILDGHLRGILLEETQRPFTDYSYVDPFKPMVDWLRTRFELMERGDSAATDDFNYCMQLLRHDASDQLRVMERDLAQTRSYRLPLSDRTVDQTWKEFYFEVDDGRWTSPQFPPDDEVRYTGYSSGMGRQSRARQLFGWFVQEMPMVRLAERVDSALARDREEAYELTARPTPGAQFASSNIITPLSEKHKDRAGRRVEEFRERTRSKAAEQMQARPPAQVVLNPQDAANNEPMIINHGGLPAEPPLPCISSGELPVLLWLDGKPPEGKKLAFVRTAYKDDKVVYQGFLGDWTRLKAELLDRISDLMPNADLLPVEDDASRGNEISDTDLTWIPARLILSDPKESVAAAAWTQVGGMLVTTWAAALVVLGVAGFGVRNLVALTERRMQFAYAVTHELRTPLTTFRLYSEMLASGMVPEESRGEYLNTLHHESERLATLVESVLEYSRLENHNIRLNPVSMDGSRLIETIGKTLEERCRSAGVEPQVRNLVPPGQSFVIDVDVVHQIAGVLINNACRHSRSSPKPKVVLQLSSAEDRLHLDVMDNGPGIDRGDQRVIFKPFRRGRKADSNAHGGIGLGLALARNWARFVKGRLDLMARHHSELGGAHFRLTVPAMMEA